MRLPQGSPRKIVQIFIVLVLSTLLRVPITYALDDPIYPVLGPEEVQKKIARDFERKKAALKKRLGPKEFAGMKFPSSAEIDAQVRSSYAALEERGYLDRSLAGQRISKEKQQAFLLKYEQDVIEELNRISQDIGALELQPPYRRPPDSIRRMLNRVAEIGLEVRVMAEARPLTREVLPTIVILPPVLLGALFMVLFDNPYFDLYESFFRAIAGAALGFVSIAPAQFADIIIQGRKKQKSFQALAARIQSELQRQYAELAAKQSGPASRKLFEIQKRLLSRAGLAIPEKERNYRIEPAPERPRVDIGDSDQARYRIGENHEDIHAAEIEAASECLPHRIKMVLNH